MIARTGFRRETRNGVRIETLREVINGRREGTPVWFELTTADPEQAQAFYAAVAGWSVGEPMQEFGGYRLANAPDGGGVAGIMKPLPGMGDVPGWVIYFASDDVNADGELVRRLGGDVKFGPADIPNVGRFVVVADPQGVLFTLMKGNGSEASRAFKATPDETSRRHGVWTKLATPDPDAALGFCNGLFGWTAQGSMPMGDTGDYTFIGTGAHFRPGAVMSSKATGAPARWNWYVHVQDIGAAVRTAEERSGKLVQGPDPIPGGEFAVSLLDPDGHAIGLVGSRR